MRSKASRWAMSTCWPSVSTIMPVVTGVAQARTRAPSTLTMQVSQLWMGPICGQVADLRGGGGRRGVCWLRLMASMSISPAWASRARPLMVMMALGVVSGGVLRRDFLDWHIATSDARSRIAESLCRGMCVGGGSVSI